MKENDWCRSFGIATTALPAMVNTNAVMKRLQERAANGHDPALPNFYSSLYLAWNSCWTNQIGQEQGWSFKALCVLVYYLDNNSVFNPKTIPVGEFTSPKASSFQKIKVISLI